jgi:hypothetical protein
MCLSLLSLTEKYKGEMATFSRPSFTLLSNKKASRQLTGAVTISPLSNYYPLQFYVLRKTASSIKLGKVKVYEYIQQGLRTEQETDTLRAKLNIKENFRPLSDCLFWTAFRKIIEVTHIFGILFLQ